MENTGRNPSRHGLENHNFTNLKAAYWNLAPDELVERAVERGEAVLSEHGALIARTGKHTGRSPNDKFLVKEP